MRDGPRRTSWLAEGEHVGAGPGVEERDPHRALADRAVLPDQLVEPLLREDPVAVLVDVEPVGAARWLPVERHPVAHGWAARRGAHHEVDVPPAEAVQEAAAGRVQRRDLGTDRPRPDE